MLDWNLMAKNRGWDDPNQMLINMYEKHRSIYVLADMLYVSHTSVWTKLKEIGVKEFNKGNTHYSYTRKFVKMANGSKRIDQRPREIAKEIGCSVSNVYLMAQKKGIQITRTRFQKTKTKTEIKTENGGIYDQQRQKDNRVARQ
jgi:biotin operon repressor